MAFTAAELAEMARADEEIEATFRLTNEDIALGRALDREAALDAMDRKQRRAAEYKRRYREANREKIAEYHRRYREANREKGAEGKRAIRQARKSLGLTQAAFAALLGVSQSTVSCWENISAPGNWKEIITGLEGTS